jgi:hypothetical protein
MCIQFYRHEPFFEKFDEKFQQFFTAGLFEYYALEWYKYLDPNRYKHLDKHEPQVLTLTHLEAGFVVWLASLSVAILAFVMEWAISLKNFLVFKLVLRAFYN